jgi:YD repeat-containing protein
LESSRYDAQGSLIYDRKFTRTGWQITKLEHTSAAPGDSSTQVQSFDADGFVAGNDTYDGNDALISRTVNNYERTSDGTQVSTSEKRDADGSVSTTKIFDSPTRQLTTKDGKSYSESFVQRDANGKPLRTVVRFADGSPSERTVQPDRVTVHNSWSQTKTKTYLTMDAQGHWLETVEESTDEYVKTRFRYDDAGRRIEVTTYDGSGKLVSKCTSEYQDDANGNWTEEKDFAVSGDKPPKLRSIRRRSITYY